MKEIFEKYPKILVFDTETTGIHPKTNEIIQFSSVTAELVLPSASVFSTFSAFTR